MAEITDRVIIGVDTHKQTHVVALISEVGQKLASKRFDANEQGYRQALRWIGEYGTPVRAGIEATGSYGAGLCAFLSDHGIECLEVYKPDKQERRRRGKDDTIDAYQAAHAALMGERSAPIKEKDAALQVAQALEATYGLTIKNRTATINALKATLIRLPDHMRSPLEKLTTKKLVEACTSFRITKKSLTAEQGIKIALRSYAQQIQAFDEQAALLEKEIDRYAQSLAPQTMKLPGIGMHSAIKLLCACGQNIERMKSEASFSMMCGVSPIPASTGDVHHFRLNRGGNRQANSALHTMAITRKRISEKTKIFIKKKMSEGKSEKDATRALKRYLAREVFYSLKTDLSNLGVVL